MHVKHKISLSNGVTIDAMVTDDSDSITLWLKDVGDGDVFGLHCKSSSKNPKKVATLPICKDSKCLVIQLDHLDKRCLPLKQFLCHRHSYFTAAGVNASKLKKAIGHKCTSVVDILDLPYPLYTGLMSPGQALECMAATFLGLHIVKPGHVDGSNWESRVLTIDQVKHACVNAYLAYRVGIYLVHGRKNLD